jgi:hypothetical protein
MLAISNALVITLFGGAFLQQVMAQLGDDETFFPNTSGFKFFPESTNVPSSSISTGLCLKQMWEVGL